MEFSSSEPWILPILSFGTWHLLIL
jgi:hypothetical protein